MVTRVAHGAVSDFPDRDSMTTSAAVQDHGVEGHFSAEQQLLGDSRASDGARSKNTRPARARHTQRRPASARTPYKDARLTAAALFLRRR